MSSYKPIQQDSESDHALFARHNRSPGEQLSNSLPEEDYFYNNPNHRNVEEDDEEPHAGRMFLASSSPTSTVANAASNTVNDIEHIEAAERRRYLYSALALLISLISFVVQTETAGYIANTLKYNKPIFIMYVTHSSWFSLWLVQILFLRIRKHNLPFPIFLRKHLKNILSTAAQLSSLSSSSSSLSPSKTFSNEEQLLTTQRNSSSGNSINHLHRTSTDDSIIFNNGGRFSVKNIVNLPSVRNLIRSCLILAVALNIAGSSWYIAVNLTTPGDLTAIYNCSAFFAYAFSVPLLNEQFRIDKAFSVLLSILGVIIVAYSGSTDQSSSSSSNTTEDTIEYPQRAWGNIVIGAGAIIYGLYEVLYKRIACPPHTVSARKQAAFANVVGSIVGISTMLLLWPIIPILHFTGIETFELPRGGTLGMLAISVVANATFSGSFLVLMSLTSPVLSSVASLLTTFIVAIVDWLLFGTPISTGGILGGILIITAFLLLSYASWKELQGDDDDEEDDIL